MHAQRADVAEADSFPLPMHPHIAPSFIGGQSTVLYRKLGDGFCEQPTVKYSIDYSDERFAMRTTSWALSILASCVLLTAPCARAVGGDWPQWRGPRQDGISSETGLLASWPEEGPPELWRITLGAGYSAVSVVGGKAYTMYGTETDELVVCIDVANGGILWKTRSGEFFENEYGNGPRATPTVDEGRVYTQGATGSLLCLDADSGDKIWGFNTLEKFGVKPLEFGMSASPVVIGDMLVVVVGAPDGKSLAALNKATGEVLWTSLSDLGGYSTPIHIDVDGTKQIVVLTGKSVVGVSAKDGRELWRHPWETTLDANVATPIYHDGRLFISSGYGTGCALFHLSVTDGVATAKELWDSKSMKNYFSTCVLHNGYLYGFNNTILTCMEFDTGDVAWRQRGFNKGSVLLADGKLIVLGERGTLALAQASAEDYEEISRVGIFEGKSWTVPTVAGGKLFLRNEEELVCLDLE